MSRRDGPRYAILIGREVRECNLMTWARWFEATSHGPGERGETDRHVGDDEAGGLRVSTVFLGLDHQLGEGPPHWFETMVFGEGALDGMTQRYSTYDQAEAGHAFVLAIARAEAGESRELVAAELARIAAHIDRDTP